MYLANRRKHFTGQSFNTLLLNGTTQAATVPDAASFTMSEISMSIWVYPTDTTAQSIFRKRVGGSYGSAAGFILEISAGKVSQNTGFEDNSGNYRAMASGGAGSVPAGVWTHIGITCISTNLRLFINGSLVTFAENSSGNPGSSNNAETLDIGKFGATRYFDGSMTLPIIADRAYSDAEWLTIYNAGKGIQPSDLPSVITDDFVMALPFNDGDLNPEDDVSGNGNDATLVNSPTYTGEELEFG